ncbi:MAG: hypothetical protein GWO20_09175 [Candidatus Korarchaeota archaeon]|nr:hypothetical protein [Candidatus Korarchaeota archaeon]
MVAPAYDHLTALVFACVLFVSGAVAVPAISYLNLLYVDQQQLRNVALEVLNSMLFDIGCPSNWGSSNPFNESGVAKFGLALSGSSSFYILDPDKVQCLVAGNPSGSLDYETVRTLLGLQDYGFNIKIVPPFNVHTRDKSEIPNLLFELNATFRNGNPIPNAHVEATILYVKGKSGYFTAETENYTNCLGKCTIEKELSLDATDYVVVLKVSVANLATVTSTFMEGFEQHTMNASIVGENITIAIPEGPGWEKDSAGVRWIQSVLVVNEFGVWPIYSGSKSNEDKITWGGAYWGWSRLFTGLSYYNPLFVIFNIDAPNPRRLVLFVGPYTTAMGYRVFNFGGFPAPSSSGAALKLERTVEIAGMPYIFELLLWKEA